jgi:hypothetical protein
MSKLESWLAYKADALPSAVGSYDPKEAIMYDSFCAGWDAASAHVSKEIAYLKAQLLLVGNQEKVVKEAYLAGQASVKK